MPELYGPLAHVTLAHGLWLLPLFPLLASVYCAWIALARAPVKHVAGVAIGGIGVAFLASLGHAVILARAPEEERYLLQHLWRMVRFGQLDASFDLALDPLASTMTLVITGIGALIFVYAAKYMEHEAPPAYARFFAWLSLFVFAMLVLVLADNFVLMFFGWEGVGLCSWGLIGFGWSDEKKARAGMKAFVVNRIGDAGFVLGIATLFWGLGGVWSENDYTPDLNARFASVAIANDIPKVETNPADKSTGVHVDEAGRIEKDTSHEVLPPTTGKGLLTMTSYSGAVLFMDDARTPLTAPGGEPLRAPFARFAVAGGIHSFRIHPGAGLDDYLVSHVAMGENREIALAPFGPTVTFRGLREQLLSKDPHGRAAIREGLIAKRAWGNVGVITLACVLLFVGAIGKSAQIPLFVWLPDAMAGPTPVSALIHAATMVTAGVYMIARLGFLFSLSATACAVVACTGALTALLAATMGFYQYDLKKILAYSTVSQLGFMMVGVGCGGYGAGVFHLVTHACFKACLFLAAGSVIHGVHAIHHDEAASQDVRNMGGLKAKMPLTARAYLFACLAITAAPIPGLAGFWSKDDILVAAFTTTNLFRVPGWLVGGALLVAAGFTSFYMWRSYFLVFEGKPPHASQADAEKIHESPKAMTTVLTVLGALSVGAGVVLGLSAKLLGGDGESLLEAWLAPSLPHATAHASVLVTWGVIAAAYSVALAGWALAKKRYGADRKEWEAAETRAPLFDLLTHAYFVDAGYDLLVVRPVLAIRDAAQSLDTWVVDGLVNGAALLTRVVAWIAGRVDDDVVDGAVRAASEQTLRAGERLRAMQSGRIQTYVYAIVAGVLALAFLQYWLR